MNAIITTLIIISLIVGIIYFICNNPLYLLFLQSRAKQKKLEKKCFKLFIENGKLDNANAELAQHFTEYRAEKMQLIDDLTAALAETRERERILLSGKAEVRTMAFDKTSETDNVPQSENPETNDISVNEAEHVSTECVAAIHSFTMDGEVFFDGEIVSVCWPGHHEFKDEKLIYVTAADDHEPYWDFVDSQIEKPFENLLELRKIDWNLRAANLKQMVAEPLDGTETQPQAINPIGVDAPNQPDKSE